MTKGNQDEQLIVKKNIQSVYPINYPIINDLTSSLYYTQEDE